MLLSYEGTYLENENFRGFMKPYKDDKFSYGALLPREEKYELTESDIASFNLSNYRRNDDASVEVIMPEFSCDTSEDLTKAFGELGINKAFTEEADFSDFTSEWVKVDGVYQKAHIEVNREGTKAAAVTVVAADILGCPDMDIEVQEVVLNRPFMYAVIHNETNIPVFVGVVQQLENLPDGENRMTNDEINEISEPIYRGICSRIFGKDWDGVIDYGRDTPEYKLFNRARTAYYNRQIQELRDIAKEVDSYMAGKVSIDNEKVGLAQKIADHMPKKLKKEKSEADNNLGQTVDDKENKLLLTPEQVTTALDNCYQKAINGIPYVSPSIEKFANDYLKRSANAELAAKDMIKNQIVKCTTSGFLTGFGGVVTLPVSIPANVGSVIYVQMRMIACTAYMAGLDVKSDQVQTLVYACLAGISVNEIIKSAGIKTGEKLAENLIKKLPGSVCTKINQKVGFRFMTKFGEKGIVNLGKMIPVAGAVVSGGFDLVETKIIGNRAYKMFFEGNFQFEDEQKSAKNYQDAIVSD